jgi:hypothetical protein
VPFAGSEDAAEVPAEDTENAGDRGSDKDRDAAGSEAAPPLKALLWLDSTPWVTGGAGTDEAAEPTTKAGPSVPLACGFSVTSAGVSLAPAGSGERSAKDR